MLFFILFFLAHILFDPPDSYQAWRDWMLSPGVRIATFVFFAALAMHAWVGLRDVVMDYVHTLAVRIFALALLALGLTGTSAWVIRILWLGHA